MLEILWTHILPKNPHMPCSNPISFQIIQSEHLTAFFIYPNFRINDCNFHYSWLQLWISYWPIANFSEYFYYWDIVKTASDIIVFSFAIQSKKIVFEWMANGVASNVSNKVFSCIICSNDLYSTILRKIWRKFDRVPLLLMRTCI